MFGVWRRQAAVAHQHQDTLRQNSPHHATANLRRHPCRVDRSPVGTTQFFVPRALIGQIPSFEAIIPSVVSPMDRPESERIAALLDPGAEKGFADRAQQDVSVTRGDSQTPDVQDSAVQVATAL